MTPPRPGTNVRSGTRPRRRQGPITDSTRRPPDLPPTPIRTIAENGILPISTRLTPEGRQMRPAPTDFNTNPA